MCYSWILRRDNYNRNHSSSRTSPPYTLQCYNRRTRLWQYRTPVKEWRNEGTTRLLQNKRRSLAAASPLGRVLRKGSREWVSGVRYLPGGGLYWARGDVIPYLHEPNKWFLCRLIKSGGNSKKKKKERAVKEKQKNASTKGENYERGEVRMI